MPEKLRIVDLTKDTSEEVVFTEEKAFIGYKPVNPENSNLQFLALMTDQSYRLIDKNDNNLLFNQSGQFQKIISTSEDYLVKSMSSGNYTIDFGYTLNCAGKPVIAQAELVKEGQEESRVTMQYSYSIDGRLSKADVKKEDSETAKSELPGISSSVEIALAHN